MNKDTMLVADEPIRLNSQTLKMRNGKKYAEVVFLGDVHLGSPQCDKARFLKMLDYCLENNIYLLLMGDLLEIGTKDSIGAGVYEQEFIGQTQCEKMTEYLLPFAKKKLILGMHRGNHELRIYDKSGIDIIKMMADNLGVPYLGDACWSSFNVGAKNYTIYSLHGRSGSRFDGTALLAIERIAVSFNCDLVVSGHSHKCISSNILIQKVEGNQVIEKKKFIVISGSYVSYDGGYGQTYGLPISKLGSPLIKFHANKHDIDVSW